MEPFVRSYYSLGLWNIYKFCETRVYITVFPVGLVPVVGHRNQFTVLLSLSEHSVPICAYVLPLDCWTGVDVRNIIHTVKMRIVRQSGHAGLR